ncbi:MAG: sigma-54-dependent transcriptional regulator [Gemmataceae bacterium]
MPSKPPDATRVLVIDDDRNHAVTVAEILEKAGFDCTVATSGTEGAARIDDGGWDVILTDLKMNDVDGLAILKKAREELPDAEVVMITGYGDVKTAVEAIKRGASNYLMKPVDTEELRAIMRKAADRQRMARGYRDAQRQLNERYGFEGVIGHSPAIQAVIGRLRIAAGTDATVLLLGETGTGKDLIARAIHNNSARKAKHFAALNTAAPNENLIEDELFGHEPGAYTGGERRRAGIFEYANGGTVFLDEIGDMPFKLQAKLLRVLDSREVTRIGSNEPIKVNVRLIAATHQDLDAKIAAKEFRMDLYQRLKVLTIRLPALRERREDISLLATHFMKEANKSHGKHAASIAEPVRRAMAAYSWPGNVRELKNFIESMVVYDSDGVLGPDDAVESEVMGFGGRAAVPAGAAVPLLGRPLSDVERYYIEEALRLTEGNREEAAKMLGIGERTLYRKIQEYKQDGAR